MSSVLNQALWQRAYDFWFNELKPKQWFVSSPELDQLITDQFAVELEALTKFPPLLPITSASLTTCNIHNARDILSAIIITDQFSRNIHRGSAKAFASDKLALSMSRYLVEKNQWHDLTTVEIQFALMPFMHHENLESQDISVAMFKKFDIKLSLSAAIEHRELIQRFGRFPHRNIVLGRNSTDDELDYLKTGKKFGQG